MKQNDSKYHQLYLMLQDADDYYPKEDRKELLDLCFSEDIIEKVSVSIGIAYGNNESNSIYDIIIKKTIVSVIIKCNQLVNILTIYLIFNMIIPTS